MSLHWIDIIIIVSLAFTTINGIRRGLIRSIFDVLAMLVAVFVAMAWYKNLAFMLAPYLKIPEMMANVLSFTVCWIIVFYAVQLVGTTVHKVLGRSFFAPINILGGGLLGLGKGLIIIGIVINLVIVFPLPTAISAELSNSVAVEWILPVIGQLYASVFKVMPENVPYVSEFFKTNTEMVFPAIK